MGALVLLLLVVVAGAVPDLCPSLAGISAHPPDLLVALAAYLSLRGSGYGAVPWSIGLGFAKDAMSLDPLGTHAFVLGAVSLLLVRDRSGEAPARGLLRAGAVALAALFAHVVAVLRSVPVSREGFSLAGLLAGFPVALWTGLLTWPLLSLLDRTAALDGLAGRARGLSA